MVIVGIDYSMTSPAMCVFDQNRGKFRFENCEFYSYFGKKKLCPLSNISIDPHLDYSCEEERFDLISHHFINALSFFHEPKIYIEGYSMGSRGKVFNIGENTGLLKWKLWNSKYIVESVPPSAVKKLATGKGNSDKIVISDQFVSETKIDLNTLCGCKKGKSPASDIIDSYYICLYGVMAQTSKENNK